MNLKDITEIIKKEYELFFNKMYAESTEEKRKELDQFFTPPEITIPMLSIFGDINNKTILDPTCGSGNLLAACLIAGADADKIFGNEYDIDMVRACINRIRTIPERLIKAGYNDKAKEVEEKLKSFDDKQIHHGNALIDVCLTVFGDEYDIIYDDLIKNEWLNNPEKYYKSKEVINVNNQIGLYQIELGIQNTKDTKEEELW